MAKYKRKPYTSSKKCKFRGIDFDSKLERDEYIRLLGLQERGVIQNLELQPHLELVKGFFIRTNAVKSGKSKQKNIIYTPDFKYTQGFDTVLVEMKGYATPVYKLRRRLFLSQLFKHCDLFIEKGANYTHEYRAYLK